MPKPQVKSLDSLKLQLKNFYLARQITMEVTARLVGLVFFIAFVSLLPQLNCLYGKDGLAPLGEFFNSLRAAHLDALSYPTLVWFKPDVTGMSIVATIGAMASLLAFCNKAKPLLLLVCYFCYLSLVQVGQDFLLFQWDILLLEVGFASAFISARGLKPEVKGLFAWLFVAIAFKLMLLSGLCKIVSNDPNWLGLTALQYHFFTQPLPTPLAVFIQALPSQWLKSLCFLALSIELIIPFAVFLGRKARLFAFGAFVLLQLTIIISGNYGFFNWLSIILFLPLLDDKALGYNATGRSKWLNQTENSLTKSRYSHAAQRLGTSLALYLLSANLLLIVSNNSQSPLLLRSLIAIPQHFYLVNSYGLFSIMTTKRPEIVIEGSNDGVHYSPYEFVFKPGNQRRPPPLVAPYQPRLDWQLWFEALRATYDEDNLLKPFSQRTITPSPWFINLLYSLQQNRSEVTGALSFNPFSKNGPKYIRARIVQYRFATPQEVLHDGIYWHSDFGESRNIYFEI